MKEHSIFTLWEEEAMHVRTVPNSKRAWRKRMPWEPLHLCMCSVGLRWWQLKQVTKCHWVLWRHGYAIVMTWFCKNEKRLLWCEVRFSALLSMPERQAFLYFLAGVSPQLSNYSERVMECWSCLSTATTKKTKTNQFRLFSHLLWFHIPPSAAAGLSSQYFWVWIAVVLAAAFYQCSK